MLLVGFLSSIMMVGQLAFAAEPSPPGGHLNITEVFVNQPAPGQITIMGADLDFGGTPVVTLGDFGPLTLVGTPTATQIVVECPPDADSIPICQAGDFLLTVSTGNGQSQNDEYDLTVAGNGNGGGGGPEPCPEGFAAINDKTCIEVDRRAEATWVSANSVCMGINARLCTAAEWAYACLDATSLGLNDLPDQLEWLGDLASGANANRLGRKVTGPSCTAGSSGLIDGSTAPTEFFRCCFDR
jgi:hypothetical protein